MKRPSLLYTCNIIMIIGRLLTGMFVTIDEEIRDSTFLSGVNDIKDITAWFSRLKKIITEHPDSLMFFGTSVFLILSNGVQVAVPLLRSLPLFTFLDSTIMHKRNTKPLKK